VRGERGMFPRIPFGVSIGQFVGPRKTTQKRTVCYLCSKEKKNASSGESKTYHEARKELRTGSDRVRKSILGEQQ